MQDNGMPWKRTARRLFWLAWPVLTIVGLALIVLQALSLLGSEGQFVNLIRPPIGVTVAKGVQLGQRFVAPRAGLYRVDVLMYRPLRCTTQPVTFHLRKEGVEDDRVTIPFNANEVWGWRWMSFRFDPQGDSEGQAYFFLFDSPTSVAEDSLALGGVEGDLYPNGTAIMNGQPAFADAAFSTFYANVTLGETLSALVGKITHSKPSMMGDGRFYTLLGVLYLLLVLRLLWQLYAPRKP